LYLNLTGADGNYALPANTELRINGTAGFGISSYDNMNNTASRFGINFNRTSDRQCSLVHI